MKVGKSMMHFRPKKSKKTGRNSPVFYLRGNSVNQANQVYSAALPIAPEHLGSTALLERNGFPHSSRTACRCLHTEIRIPYSRRGAGCRLRPKRGCPREVHPVSPGPIHIAVFGSRHRAADTGRAYARKVNAATEQGGSVTRKPQGVRTIA